MVKELLKKFEVKAWDVPEFEVLEYLPKTNKICICIFVINEMNRLQSQLQKMQLVTQYVDIIIADGGSNDGCVDESITKPFGVKATLVKLGSGKLGAQMRMAFAYAIDQGYEAIITVDGNDKDDVVAGLPGFISKLNEGFDHIQGSRFISGGHHSNTPLLRLIAVKLIHAPLISLVSGFKYTDTTNGFRGYSTKLLIDPKIAIFRKELSGYELHYYIAIESARQKYKCIEVPVSRSYPLHGKIPTKISFFSGNFKVLFTLFKVCLGFYKL
jgi:dolichol-phosphate mannosyltransferase